MTATLYVIDLPESTVLQLEKRRGKVAWRVPCEDSVEGHLELRLLPSNLTEETLASWERRRGPNVTGHSTLYEGVPLEELGSPTGSDEEETPALGET